MFGLGLSKIRTSEEIISLKTHQSSSKLAELLWCLWSLLKPFKRQRHQPRLFKMWISEKKGQSCASSAVPPMLFASFVWNDCLLFFQFGPKMQILRNFFLSLTVQSLCIIMSWNQKKDETIINYEDCSTNNIPLQNELTF